MKDLQEKYDELKKENKQILKVSLKYETTQYQLEQLVEYLTHNGFLITELKQEDYNE